jgi:hypothetical protein
MYNNRRYASRARKWSLGLWLLVAAISIKAPAVAQSQGPASVNGIPENTASAPQSASEQSQTGGIRGTVVDQSGALMANVKITLTQQGLTLKREALSDRDGQFAFAGVAPGPFQLSVTASGFATQQISGVLHSGEDDEISQIALVVARANIDVFVTESTAEVAEDELKIEEKQRVLGVIPNFYVSYIPHAAPLPPRLKFQLAWRSIIDPVSFVVTGGIAGIQQAENDFAGYGQGAQGYAKRYGAAYGDFVSATFIGGAILPSLLKQDPRYFYKGTGSTRSRLLYAIANSVICKGDNGRWQPNYSGIIGGLAAGGISNWYYPAQNRNGLSLTFENALIGIGGGAASNILQEFVVRRFTPHVSAPEASKP